MHLFLFPHLSFITIAVYLIKLVCVIPPILSPRDSSVSPPLMLFFITIQHHYLGYLQKVAEIRRFLGSVLIAFP